MTLSSSPLQFERRPLSDPVVAELLTRYLAEIAQHIEGFDATRATPPSPEDFDPPAGLFLIGFAAGSPVACGGLRHLSVGVGEIRRMWVTPESRGRGYGRAMLDALEEAARAAGYSSVVLDTNGSLTAALALYRGAGYAESERYNDNPFAEHFFAKRLG